MENNLRNHKIQDCFVNTIYYNNVVLWKCTDIGMEIIPILFLHINISPQERTSGIHIQGVLLVIINCYQSQ